MPADWMRPPTDFTFARSSQVPASAGAAISTAVNRIFSLSSREPKLGMVPCRHYLTETCKREAGKLQLPISDFVMVVSFAHAAQILHIAPQGVAFPAIQVVIVQNMLD